MPAYELRRTLALARGRGESFALEYTHLPPALRTPSEWKAYSGDKVRLVESGRGTPPSCVVLPSAEVCGPDEVSLKPPPSWLLRKVLIPYPIPLLEGAGDGIHCTT